MSRLRIGTCSWKYPSWESLVYSAPKGINYLEEYARQYATVEVDQWFWSLFPGSEPKLPRESDVREYRAAVPADFRFTVKAPNSLTLTHFHGPAKGAPLAPNPHFLSPDLGAGFLATLAPLADVRGPVIFQFEYLNRQKMSGQAEFQERLAGFLAHLPPGPDYALETRNPNYLNEAYFAFVASQDLTPVLLQGYWMPPIGEVYARWRPLLRERRTVVMRLHGPDREGMEKETAGRWDRLVVKRDEELQAIARMTGELLDEGADVYLNVNNHYEGSAPLTVRRLEALLHGTG